MKFTDFVNARLDYLIRTHAHMPCNLDLDKPTFEHIEHEAHRQAIRGQIAFYQSLKTITEGTPHGQGTITSINQPRLQPFIKK